MEIIGAVAAIVAAVTGLVALGLQLWWRRPDLGIAFSGESGGGGQPLVTISVRVTNHADHTARDVRVVGRLDANEVAVAEPEFQTIQPYGVAAYAVRLERPEQADLSGGTPTTFHGRTFSVRVSCGRRSTVVEHGKTGRLH